MNRNQLDLAKQADAILRRARYDAVTGAEKDREYRRTKRAERKLFGHRWRAKQKQLGTFGAASTVRTITTAE